VIPKPELVQFQANIKGSPCMDILRLALKKVATERQGTLTEGYTDCTWHFHQCILGLRTGTFSKGIGVDVDVEGQVVFVYDRKDANQAEAQSIARDIARSYAVIAIMRVQKKMGYSVHTLQEVKQGTGRTVRVQAIRA
jgi:hypothetical protein